MVSVIEVEQLHKSFLVKEKEPGLRGSIRSVFRPSIKEVEAVKKISFAVDSGELLAFIGPNGAGKSTTIKMLTGILYPTSGKARVLDLVPWEARQKLAFSIGSVFGQKSQLWYHLPALDSFRLLASVYELESRTYNRRINELIELFELAEFIKTPVRKLSLGQRMRCELAACILHQPKVIFLDEPTIGLDVVVKVKIRELIKRVNQEEGTTIFLTSHDAGDIEQLCKRVIVINHGDIILDAATSHLRHNYLSWKIVKVKFAEPNPNLKLRGAEVIKHTDKGIKFRINTNRIKIEQVLTDLMQQARVADISIEDPTMEEIIENIYRQPDKEGVLNAIG